MLAVQLLWLASAVTALATETACTDHDQDSAVLLQGPPTRHSGMPATARTAVGTTHEASLQTPTMAEEGEASSLLSPFSRKDMSSSSSKAPSTTWNSFLLWSRQITSFAISQCHHFIKRTKSTLLQTSHKDAVVDFVQQTGVHAAPLVLLFVLVILVLAGCLAMGLTFSMPTPQKYANDSLVDTPGDSSGRVRAPRKKTFGCRSSKQSLHPRVSSLSSRESAESEAEINTALRPCAMGTGPTPLTMRHMQHFAAELMPHSASDVGIPSRPSLGGTGIDAVLAPELVVPNGHECIIHIPIFPHRAPPEYALLGPDGTNVLRVAVESSPSLGSFSGAHNSMHPGTGPNSMILERTSLFDPEGNKPYGMLELMLADGDGANIQAFLVSGSSQQRFLSEEVRNAQGQRALLLVDPLRRDSMPVLVAQVHDKNENTVTFSGPQRFMVARAEPGRLASGSPCSVLSVRPGMDVALIVLALFALERTVSPEYSATCDRIRSQLVPASPTAALQASRSLSRGC